MRIGELARNAGVSRDTIRHYVEIGLLIPQRDPGNGYQLFDAGAVQRLRFIRMARALGFQLDEVRHIFAKADKGCSPCADVRDIIQLRIAETRSKIAELEALCARMQDAVDQWHAMPDGQPTGSSVCRLIESQIESTTLTP